MKKNKGRIRIDAPLGGVPPNKIVICCFSSNTTNKKFFGSCSTRTNTTPYYSINTKHGGCLHSDTTAVIATTCFRRAPQAGFETIALQTADR